MYAAITFMAQIFGWDLFYFIMKELMSDPTDSFQKPLGKN